MNRYVVNLLSALYFGLFLGGVGLAKQAVASDLDDIIESCAQCHGKDGASMEDEVPIIAGYSAVYTIDNLTAYREKERPCPETEYREGDKKGDKTDMCHVVKDLSDDEIKKVAEYFANKPFVRAKQEFDGALAEKGKAIHEEHCEKCHGEGGSVPSDDSGILAGQWMPYLKQTFKEYESKERTQPKKMEKKMNLNAEEVDALIQYYGSFQ